MSTVKHTQGPWRSSISKNNRLQISGDNGRQVCIVWRDEYSEANARLIAAAPELLEALKEVTEWRGSVQSYIEHNVDSGCHSGITNIENCSKCQRTIRALAAITKAEGAQ